MTNPGDERYGDPAAPGPFEPPEPAQGGFHPAPPEQPAAPGEPPQFQKQAPADPPPAPQFPPPAGQGMPPMPPPPVGYGYGQGAVAPAGMYYDPASELTLPDGTVLAPIGRRIGAYFLSILLCIVTLVIGYIVWGLILWSKGTTPALKVLGMRVWRPAENRPATFWQMVLRDVLGRIVDGILGGITQLISFIMFLANKQHKSLHDMVASTVVLHDPNKVLPQ